MDSAEPCIGHSVLKLAVALVLLLLVRPALGDERATQGGPSS
jgi:hypothetical protein